MSKLNKEGVVEVKASDALAQFVVKIRVTGLVGFTIKAKLAALILKIFRALMKPATVEVHYEQNGTGNGNSSAEGRATSGKRE